MRRSVVAMVLAAASAPASAAFFQIAEQSASGMGNAFAGGAAIAEDASTVWYNPAGMTRFRRFEIVASGSYIAPSFTADVTHAQTATGPVGGGGGNGGEAAFVPSLYAVLPISSRFAVGAGVNAPFGLATDYPENWAGRYYALRSDIKTVNLNLAAAYKLHDVLSVGVGANHQSLDAQLTQAVDFASICTAGNVLVPGSSAACGVGHAPPFIQPGNPNDGKATIMAKGDAWGYNAGLFSRLADTRIGLAYRSQIKYKLNGSFDMQAPSNVPQALLTNPNFRLVDSGASADVTLPATISLSAVQQIGGRWEVMADVTRTNWHVLPELRIKFDSGQPDQVVTLNLKDAYRYSIGATYQANDAWTLRGGLALDRSPVSNAADRTPRLPDSDRRWISMGAGWRASPNWNFDFAYTYIKLADSSVQKIDGGENLFRGDLTANYKGSVQILAAQVRWAF